MSDTATSLPVQTFLAQGNLTVAGLFVPWGTEAELPLVDDVSACVAAGLLVPCNPDGSYPEKLAPQPPRCCGG